MRKVFCITGKAGAGKSTVAKILKKRGFRVINVDRLAHIILEENKDIIKKVFGEDVVIKGKISRKKLGEKVFRNPKLFDDLEQIIHPLVKERLRNVLNKLDGIIFIDVAIPEKLGIKEFCEKVILIHADQQIIKHRLKNLGWSDEKISEVMKRQTREYMEPDFVIENNGPVELLEKQINDFLKEVELC